MVEFPSGVFAHSKGCEDDQSYVMKFSFVMDRLLHSLTSRDVTASTLGLSNVCLGTTNLVQVVMMKTLKRALSYR